MAKLTWPAVEVSCNGNIAKYLTKSPEITHLSVDEISDCDFVINI